MEIRIAGLAILSMLTLPMGSVMAQQGYAFRPLDSTEVVEAAPISPGWQVNPNAQAGIPSSSAPQTQDSYRYAPQAPSSAMPNPAYNQRTDNGAYPNYRYKPEESGVAMTQPPPLPQAGASVNPSMSGSGYGMQQNPAQPGAPGSPWINPMTPPGYPSPSGSGQEAFGASAPPQQLPRLESRYIEGPSHLAQSYPFRPLEEEKKPEKAVSPAQPRVPSSGVATGYAQAPYAQAPYTSAYPYPPMPMGPGYLPPQYDNYNSGPSFGGFRFPFSNGGFPFGFK